MPGRARTAVEWRDKLMFNAANVRQLILAGRWEDLRQTAVRNPRGVLRSVIRRLYTEVENEKWLAVQALGRLVEDRTLYPEPVVRDLARRFVWSLNDESGTVPYGIPEALGELLALRPELQADFLPILCALLIEEEMAQEGPILEGAIWAVGRVGLIAAQCCPELVPALKRYASEHPDSRIRKAAQATLSALGHGSGGDRCSMR